MASAITVSAPNSARSPVTVDLPAPIPPVQPMAITIPSTPPRRDATG